MVDACGGLAARFFWRITSGWGTADAGHDEIRQRNSALLRGPIRLGKKGFRSTDELPSRDLMFRFLRPPAEHFAHNGQKLDSHVFAAGFVQLCDHLSEIYQDIVCIRPMYEYFEEFSKTLATLWMKPTSLAFSNEDEWQGLKQRVLIDRLLVHLSVTKLVRQSSLDL